jgi:tetratricopeptide (TPR) repeat protein
LVAEAVAGISQRAGRSPGAWTGHRQLRSDPAVAVLIVVLALTHAFARPGLVAGGVPAAVLLTLGGATAAGLAVWTAARITAPPATGQARSRTGAQRGGGGEIGAAAGGGPGPGGPPRPGLGYAAGRGTVVYLMAVGILSGAMAAIPLLAETHHKEARLVWLPLAQEARADAEAGKAAAFFGEAAARFAQASRFAPWSSEPLLSLGRLETERANNADEQLGRLVVSAGETAALADEYAAGLPPGGAELVADRDAAFERSLAALDAADGLWSPHPEPALTRARALRVWAERTRSAVARRARLTAAADAYEVVMRRAPNWPEVYDEAAWVALLADAPAHALTLTDRALAVDPFFLRAHRTAAAAHAALGDDDAAIVAYEAYFRDDRNTGDLPALRGQLAALLRLDRGEAALPIGESVALLAPDDAHTQADLAILREAVGDAEGALEAARRAAHLAPNDGGIAALVRELEQRLPSTP